MTLPLSLTRLLLTWLAMAVAMSANGITRELVLKRAMRPNSADVLSALIGMALMAAITAVGFRPLGTGRASLGQLVLVSAMLVVLTVVFETVIGRVVDHKSWAVLLEHYAFWRGELWPVVLAWLACMPFLWARVPNVG
jgi:hypothetical protein